MDNPGRISKAGDPDVRAALYAAANAMMMRSVAGSEIKSWGLRLMRQKSRRRDVVAVAQKLAVIMRRMWADGTAFRQRPWKLPYELINAFNINDGIVLSGRGLWMTQKTAAAPREALD